MTGFGRGVAAGPSFELTVEIRSVNHRYCEIRAVLHGELARLTGTVEKRVRDRFARGRFDVVVSISGAASPGGRPEIDVDLARGYLEAYRRLAGELELDGPVELRLLVEAPGVVGLSKTMPRTEDLSDTLERAVELAAAELSAMREREGLVLTEAILGHVSRMKRLAHTIDVRAPVAVGERRDRLKTRLAELMDGMPLDEGRFAQEIAVLADRVDIVEELERLDAHFGHMESLIHSDQPVGRRLDFLVQEMNRETNTLGAKASDAVIAHAVVEMKAELERLREQVQNLE